MNSSQVSWRWLDKYDMAGLFYPLFWRQLDWKMKAISLLNSDGKVTSCVHIAALQAIDRKGSISGLLLLIITFFFLHADSLVFVLFAHTSQIIHPKA